MTAHNSGGNGNSCASEECTLNKLDPLLGFCNSMLDFDHRHLEDVKEILTTLYGHYKYCNKSCNAEGMHKNDLDVGNILELALLPWSWLVLSTSVT